MMFAESWWGFCFKAWVFRTVVIVYRGPGWNLVELTTCPWRGDIRAPDMHTYLMPSQKHKRQQEKKTFLLIPASLSAIRTTELRRYHFIRCMAAVTTSAMFIDVIECTIMLFWLSLTLLGDAYTPCLIMSAEMDALE